MDNNPWEFFVIDDSDLSSFVCPSNPNLSSSNSTILIPSPRGVVQAVRINQQYRETLPTQEFIMRVHQDPIWTIDATLQQTIIEDKDFGQYIAIGFVLILQEAVLFCPFPPHSKCYLNITLHNIVKVMFFNILYFIILYIIFQNIIYKIKFYFHIN
ncbi:hypothetical protein HKD37_01G000742 [Glycine soja]